MGGFGSGNHGLRLNRKTLTDRCHQLDVNRLARQGLLQPWQSGSLTWSDSDTGTVQASVGYTVVPEGDKLCLVLRYQVGNSGIIDLPIRLETTTPYLGGVRWWFICPLYCGRRCAKLYLHGRYFGCRKCHDLTYRSCAEAHSFERLHETLWKLGQAKRCTSGII